MPPLCLASAHLQQPAPIPQRFCAGDEENAGRDERTQSKDQPTFHVD